MTQGNIGENPCILAAESAFSADCPTMSWVGRILDAATHRRIADRAAYHLVGATLQIQFPHYSIECEPPSTADDQLDRPGDFCIGDTAFHVTVAPMPGVYDRCKANIAAGYRVFLLVPDRSLAGARQNAEIAAAGQVEVESLESFIAQNIEELSVFSRDRLASGILLLLETYNARVNAVELDKSMMVEIPKNLQNLKSR